MADPFLKWAGGKRRLLPDLLKVLPGRVREGTYYEPFLGAGALFFAASPTQAVLSDTNRDLVRTFEAVRNDVEGVITRLRRLKYNETSYYEIRRSRPRLDVTHAARMIYLSKTCFNGLYRVNLAGEFNVPFGRHHAGIEVCDEDQLREASRALQGADLRIDDFEAIVECAEEGDVVYCDPPYTTAHTNNGFIEYNARVFGWEDQDRLARVARSAVARGALVVVSNAYHQSIIDLYPTSIFRMEVIKRWSTVAAASEKRFSTSELLIVGGKAS